MRRLGPVQNVLRATINLGTQIEATNNNVESTKPQNFWARMWNEQDIRIMVLISLALQLFLLFAGNVRPRRRVGWLRILVWLAYLAAYAVAASAIGLFSQYEGKYKLRSLETSEDLHRMTMPFLWAPFLLLHLGGPDTITAFSIEDNNLWLRQLINLAFQVSLALYVFWKSFDLLDWQLLVVAVPLFVAGIIKYGERIWALQKGSQDGLDSRPKKGPDPGTTERPSNDLVRLTPGDAVASYALDTVLQGKGLLVGRTISQLGYGFARKFVDDFLIVGQTEGKLKIILMELGMIYDMLYTKVIVLQSWIGATCRCVALVSMVVAFVLFWVNQHLHAYRTINAAITYTLFIAAISMEVYSIFMVIASPWTRARSRQGTILCWLCSKASSFSKQGLSTPSMGQFNVTDYSMSRKSTPKFIYMVCEALGLEKHWRNFRYVKHVQGEVMLDYIVALFETNTDRNSELYPCRLYPLQGRDEKLKFLLNLPFELALFRLHISTEIYLSKLDSDVDDMVLGAECRELSNYLMYLMAVHPSMLPVSSAARDLVPLFARSVRDHNYGNMTKAKILETHKLNEVVIKMEPGYPFQEHPSATSLKEMKEVWLRVLIYAAGKCQIEQHARQLGNGVELLTMVGALMMHLSLGDVGTEFKLCSDDSDTDKWEPLLYDGLIIPAVGHRPLYAFKFPEQVTYGGTDARPQTTEEEAHQRGKGKEIEEDGGQSSQVSGYHLAVSCVVQPPQGQIQRSSSI